MKIKVNRNRRAISQSLDLFIIIGAVLAVGALVVAALFGLIGSASSTSSLQITGISVYSSSSSLSFSLKNVGTSAVTIGSNTVIKLTGLSVSTPASFTCPPPTSYAGTSSVSWTEATTPTACGSTTAGTVNTITYSGPTSSVTLSPGQVLTFSANPVLATSSGTTVPDVFTAGSTYTVQISGPGIQISENVISQ